MINTTACKRLFSLGCVAHTDGAVCRSTAAEGLEDPRTELCPLVKYFAERKKIFNIHFRNVVGGHHKESGLPNFSEVWPDEGDVDMFELAETLYDAGYEYMLMRTLSPCCFGGRPALLGRPSIGVAVSLTLNAVGVSGSRPHAP